MGQPAKKWPPFCANAVEELKCPYCEDGGEIFVREKDYYTDQDQIEAFCGDCHTELEVTANCGEITFTDVLDPYPEERRSPASGDSGGET